jgi:hypothetical protein
VLKEAGLEEALLGLSLNKNQPLDNMLPLLSKLATKDFGHNKAMESIAVWLDITAPRYFWQQFDTYRIGVSKQSQSTMHTGMKRELTQADFSMPIPDALLDDLNFCIREHDFDRYKALLPESFLQRRVVSTNYKALRNMYQQRRTHRLQEWKELCDHLYVNLQYGEWLV